MKQKCTSDQADENLVFRDKTISTDTSYYIIPKIAIQSWGSDVTIPEERPNDKEWTWARSSRGYLGKPWEEVHCTCAWIAQNAVSITGVSSYLMVPPARRPYFRSGHAAGPLPIPWVIQMYQVSAVRVADVFSLWNTKHRGFLERCGGLYPSNRHREI